MLCGCWLYIKSKESGIVFLVGSAPICKALQTASTAHCSNKANPTLHPYLLMNTFTDIPLAN